MMPLRKCDLVERCFAVRCSRTHTLWNSRIEWIRPLIPGDLGGRFFDPFCNDRYLLAEDPMDSRSANQMSLRQLAQALTVLAAAEDCRSIEDQGLPSDVPTFELGPPHAGAHTLDDEAALQLGDGADDHHDRSSQRTTGVDLFA